MRRRHFPNHMNHHVGSLAIGIPLLALLLGIVTTIRTFFFVDQSSVIRVLSTRTTALPYSSPGETPGISLVPFSFEDDDEQAASSSSLSRRRLIFLLPRGEAPQGYQLTASTEDKWGTTGSSLQRSTARSQRRGATTTSINMDEQLASARSMWSMLFVACAASASFGAAVLIGSNVVQEWINQDEYDPDEEDGKSDHSRLGYQSCASDWTGDYFDKFDL